MKRSSIIYLLFFLSGISTLIYEIVWTRMLTLAFGHTVFSVSITLTAFMAGLGYGALLWGQKIDTEPHPLIIYAKIEITIAISCALLSPLIAKFGPIYAWLNLWIPSLPLLAGLVKVVLAFLLIFGPATLMGATFPIISKYYVEDDTRLSSKIGLLYAINTFGAATGCALTGFILIPALGVLQTSWLAAGINLFIGIGSVRVFQESKQGMLMDWNPPLPSLPKFDWCERAKFWFAVSFVCGFTALAYEVLWTRLLVFSIASTAYAFSMMLTVFLLGIVLGSLLVIPALKICANPRTLLIILQASAGIYVVASMYGLESILSAPWNSYNLQKPSIAFFKYFKDSTGLMLPPTIFLGMCFPLLIRALVNGPPDIGRGAALIYTFNTLGGITGSLAGGFLLLPLMGSLKSLILIAMINLACSIWLFTSGTFFTDSLRKTFGGTAAVFTLGLFFVIPGDLINGFFMRDSTGKREVGKLLYFDEGISDTVAVFKDNYGILDPEAKRLITNGVSMSASNKIASRYMKLLAHFPILLRDNPKDVLVICFGTGQTAGAASVHSEIERVDVVDLSSGVVDSGKVFSAENNYALNNSKIHITLQGGRNYLLTTQNKYDVVTAEPPPPRTAFTVNLYTKEYYELTKQVLKPGGIVAQWIPLHSQSEEEIYLHFKTFRESFPYILAWMPVANEMILIGSNQPVELDFEKLQRKMEIPELKRALTQIEINNVYSLLGCLWMFEDQIEKLAGNRNAITDNHPSIEFYLNFQGVIQGKRLEKIIFNRTPFDKIARRISNMKYEDQKKLKAYYQAMGYYQRGVVYGDASLLLDSVQMVEDNNLFRYHLQGEKLQITRLKKKNQKNPNDLETLLNLSRVHFQIGKYKKSLKFLDQAKAQSPNETLTNLYTAYNKMKLGQFSEAKKLFKSVGKSNPRFLGNLFQDIALVELMTKLNEKPRDKGLMLAAAEFYNRRHDYGESLKYSLKVLEQDQMHPKALRSIIISYRGRGEPNEVMAYGVQLENIEPDDLQLKYIMAEMFVKTLRCNKAEPYLRDILKKDDTFPNVENLMSQCGILLKVSKDFPMTMG